MVFGQSAWCFLQVYVEGIPLKLTESNLVEVLQLGAELYPAFDSVHTTVEDTYIGIYKAFGLHGIC